MSFCPKYSAIGFQSCHTVCFIYCLPVYNDVDEHCLPRWDTVSGAVVLHCWPNMNSLLNIKCFTDPSMPIIPPVPFSGLGTVSLARRCLHVLKEGQC